MGRPPDSEWAVLDEPSDPIPGSPYDIRAEGTRLGRFAQLLHEQIGLLKDLAGDDSIGKYADKIRESSSEITDDLGKLATRYESVSGYLNGWAGDLEGFQADSLKPLAQAQAAAPLANQPEMSATPGSQPPPTPAQQAKATAAAKAKTTAQGEVAAAIRQLAGIKSNRDTRGKYWMQKIEDAEHDGLKDNDGWWDDIKDFIHNHAGWIKLLADVATWVATALLLAALLIPGFDIGAAVLLGIMAVALAGHTALALSGDGSWTDVALDVFAMVTVGLGAEAKAGLETGSEFGDIVAGLLGDGGEGAEGAEGAEGSSGLWSSVADWGKAVGSKFMSAGEKELVEYTEKFTDLAEQFPDSKLFPMLLKEGATVTNQVRAINGAATIVDEMGHWLGGSDTVNFMANLVDGDGGSLSDPNVEGTFAPSAEWFTKLKELTTVGIGS